MSIRASFKTATKCVFKTNKKLPCDPIVGPVREPPSFEVPRILAQEALDNFADGEFRKGFAAYEAAFAAFADRAEIAVANANDLPLPEWSSRATEPKVIQVPIVPSLVSGPKRLSAHGHASNLLQKIQEVSAQLTAAWKQGSRGWVKLKTTATNFTNKEKAVTAEQKPDECPAAADVEVNGKIAGVKERFLSLCSGAINLAATHLRDPAACNADDGWRNYLTCTCSAAAIRKECSTVVTEAKDKEKAAADAKWAEWQAKEVSGCTAAAHRFSRVPREWKPPEVFDDKGKRAESSQDILRIEAGKYRALWDAHDLEEEVRF